MLGGLIATFVLAATVSDRLRWAYVVAGILALLLLVGTLAGRRG